MALLTIIHPETARFVLGSQRDTYLKLHRAVPSNSVIAKKPTPGLLYPRHCA